MKITNALIIKVAILSAMAITTACQTGNASNNNAAVNNQTAEKTTANTVKNTETTKTTEVVSDIKTAETEIVKTETSNSTMGSLATPTEAYKTAYAVRKNKDIPGLKRVLSKDALEFMGMISEAQQKSLDDGLRQMTETPQAATDESRNEKISGDRATLEYPDENGKWKTLDFVKEGADWKLTIPRGDNAGKAKTK
jgi:hypothetical protein